MGPVIIEPIKGPSGPIVIEPNKQAPTVVIAPISNEHKPPSPSPAPIPANHLEEFKVLLPMIRKIIPVMIANDIVSVQPMQKAKEDITNWIENKHE